MGWSFVAGGIKWCGHEGQGFAFDNEGPRHRVYLRTVSARLRPGDAAASIWHSSKMAAMIGPNSGSPTVGTPSNASLESPALLGEVAGAWWLSTLGGFRRVTNVGARLPR